MFIPGLSPAKIASTGTHFLAFLCNTQTTMNYNHCLSQSGYFSRHWFGRVTTVSFLGKPHSYSGRGSFPVGFRCNMLHISSPPTKFRIKTQTLTHVQSPVFLGFFFSSVCHVIVNCKNRNQNTWLGIPFQSFNPQKMKKWVFSASCLVAFVSAQPAFQSQSLIAEANSCCNEK